MDVPGNYSDAYKDLVKSLLRTHAWERPTAATLLAHPIATRGAVQLGRAVVSRRAANTSAIFNLWCSARVYEA